MAASYRPPTSRLICLCSSQLGHIEGEPMRRGAFPVTFVHFIADWNPGLGKYHTSHYHRQNIHHRPSVCSRRHRHHHHHLRWRLERARSSVTAAPASLGVTGVSSDSVVLMLAVKKEKQNKDDCSECPLAINALFLSFPLLYVQDSSHPFSPLYRQSLKRQHWEDHSVVF